MSNSNERREALREFIGDLAYSDDPDGWRALDGKIAAFEVAVRAEERRACADDADRLWTEYAGDGCTVRDSMQTFARWLRAQ